MLKYLEDKFGERATQGDKSNLVFMRGEVERLQALVDAQNEKTKGTTDDEKAEDRNSESETDEDVSATPHLIKSFRMKMTTSTYFHRN